MNAVSRTPRSLPPGASLHVGCASGFWGDSQIAIPQLLGAPRLDYLVFDYLAETTMSILQRARMRNPALGYATDFVTQLEPHLATLLQRGVRLVSNAGGLNPEACRAAILAMASKQGLAPRVAVVTGDDVSALAAGFQDEAGAPARVAEVFGPLLSANAYLGATPIARALALGADIVVTGRGVDSACLLGAAMHEFGWAATDYDRLAQASLAGHLIECGAQATGGLFTDWESVPNWANIGYPIVEIQADGSFELSKPPGTGGLVSRGTVAEQMLYEIGDPAAYELPDVVCDFRSVRIEESGAERVRVTGALGRAPSARYKVTATGMDGHQIALMMAIRGQRARAKAQRTADELLARTRSLLRQAELADYTDARVELLGAEAMYGEHARTHESREIILRIAARHAQRRGLEFLQKESTSAGTSMGPGTRSHFGGRADIQSVIKTAAFFIDKSAVAIRLDIDGHDEEIELPPLQPAAYSVHLPHVPDVAVPPAPAGQTVRVPLSSLAYARSGDKGDDANIGVIAREPGFWPVLLEHLTAAQVRDYFGHLLEGEVTRFELPGTQALNFVLRRALGGGGSCSLRSDPLGKSYAQMLLDLEIPCATHLLAHQTPQQPKEETIHESEA